MDSFRRYMHVERLDSDECEGLLDNDRIYITAKVDGSNGCVWWDIENNSMACGSRNYVLSESKDNAYFYVWCQEVGEEQNALRAFCEQYPQFVVYGEWMGRDKFVGAFKRYDSEAKGKFLLFDVYDRERQVYLSDSEWRPMLAEAGLEPYFIKVLAVLNHPSEEDVLLVAKSNDFLLQEAGGVGEGVVCKVSEWRNRYGRQAYGKLVMDEFKKQKNNDSKDISNIELDIVNFYMTDAELEKTASKVCVRCDTAEFDTQDRKMLGMYRSLCWRDLLEECPNWVKRFKNPKVDFGRLAGICNARIEEYLKFFSSK